MTDVRRVDPGEIALMLFEAAEKHGYTLIEADKMWKDGTLEEPDLRDLWLIYGFVVDEGRAVGYQATIQDSRRTMGPPDFVAWTEARIAELDARLAAVENRGTATS